MRTRRRSAITGSSTVPTVFDKGLASMMDAACADVVPTAQEAGPIGFILQAADGFAVQ